MHRGDQDSRLQTLLGYDVSRETFEKLEWFSSEFRRWNTKINLVSPKTIPEFWSRHLLDSAQIFPVLTPVDRCIVDLGSGGGLPGLVLAILDKEQRCARNFHLVDADQRKSAFSSHVSRQLDLNVTVHSQRIEHVLDLKADVVVSRALAPLPELLNLSDAFLKPGSRLILLKGRNVGDELDAALEMWRFSYEKYQSKTDPTASILVISGPIERIASI